MVRSTMNAFSQQTVLSTVSPVDLLISKIHMSHAIPPMHTSIYVQDHHH